MTEQIAMETIHVVYGASRTGAAARAHSLAVERRTALVHEIDTDEDIRLILQSRYRQCIAVLDAGDEDHARSTMSRFAANAEIEMCPLTFEAVPILG
ncbi:hypothetical protein [Pararhizobium mangrovi]|uniref:Uncharacterized protein n=1 Tax=Pararhizobium mangrovi TaxID=2590452 RepID=A0A506U8A4_9HYPH|nr:hypothetical protein [Pararhizobium mangrovi]TPW30652.1 hypothetical protein FJU11_04285 [Pararhizobium mangrovi]